MYEEENPIEDIENLAEEEEQDEEKKGNMKKREVEEWKKKVVEEEATKKGHAQFIMMPYRKSINQKSSGI